MWHALIGLIAIGIAYHALCLLALCRKLGSARSAPRPESATGEPFLPPVSILKPIKGLDGDLRENLLSFVQQDYPQFEIVFGVQDPDDPAIPLLEKLRAERPECRIRVVVNPKAVGFNPKVNNLVAMMPATQHEFLVISDSNVRVGPDYLRRNIGYFRDPRAGLVTNLIRGQGAKGVAGILECLNLNTFVIGNVSLMDMFRQPCVVGKSIFFRRSQMEALGGLKRFRNYLAEDYLMGKAYVENGYKVVVSPCLVDAWARAWTLRQFVNRQTRWAKLRSRLNPAAYAGELAINFPLWAAVLCATRGFSAVALQSCAAVWLFKILLDSLANRRLGSPLPGYAPLAGPIKDLVAAILWPVPICSSKTEWRGNRLRIAAGSLLVPAN